MRQLTGAECHAAADWSWMDAGRGGGEAGALCDVICSGSGFVQTECDQCNYFTEMCSASEAGSYLRLIDICITQL